MIILLSSLSSCLLSHRPPFFTSSVLFSSLTYSSHNLSLFSSLYSLLSLNLISLFRSSSFSQFHLFPEFSFFISISRSIFSVISFDSPLFRSISSAIPVDSPYVFNYIPSALSRSFSLRCNLFLGNSSSSTPIYFLQYFALSPLSLFLAFLPDFSLSASFAPSLHDFSSPHFWHSPHPPHNLSTFRTPLSCSFLLTLISSFPLLTLVPSLSFFLIHLVIFELPLHLSSSFLSIPHDLSTLSSIVSFTSPLLVHLSLSSIPKFFDLVYLSILYSPRSIVNLCFYLSLLLITLSSDPFYSSIFSLSIYLFSLKSLPSSSLFSPFPSPSYCLSLPIAQLLISFSLSSSPS